MRAWLLSLALLGFGALSLALFGFGAPSLAGEPPGHAREVDTSSQISFLRSRVSCAEFDRYTDLIKEPLLQLDRYLRSSTTISLSEEERIGNEALGQIAEVFSGTLVSSGAWVDYLRSVARPFLAQVKRRDVRYRFHVLVGADSPNAFALPGGHIVFTDAIFREWIRNEAQLATILAHEIAHVDERHPVAIIQYIKAIGGDESNWGNQLAMSVAKMPYSSAVEGEADALGAGMMHRSGYSVIQSVRMWERLGASSSPSPSGGWLNEMLSEVDNLLASHPDDAKRACTLKQVAYDLHRARPLRRSYIGQTNWRRKVSMGQRAY